ncbi:Exo-glucosaminidase LytG precursor [compost metagenome]
MKKAEFINRISPDAIYFWERSGVSASLTIAQAALESNWGSSKLTILANNLFGIKGEGPAGGITMLTTEYRSGKAIRINDQFRKYDTWKQSLSDHTALLLKKRYRGVIKQTGKKAAYAIQTAGYATDPGYAVKLIALMDRYDLYQYDKKQ